MAGLITGLSTGIWGYVAAAVVAAGLSGYAVHRWDASTIADMKLADAQMATDAIKKASDMQKAADQITLDAAVKDAKAQPEIITHYQTITKEIPVHVSDTAHCITYGLVRVLNRAAGAGAYPVPDAASKPDDACAPVSWREFASDISADYQAKAQNDQQLTDLQGWIMAQVATAK